MRLRILALLLLIGFISEAQPGYTTINSRYSWRGGRFTDGLHVPGYNGAPSTVTTGIWIGDGAVAVDTANHRWYFYSGGAWIRGASYTELSSTSTGTEAWISDWRRNNWDLSKNLDLTYRDENKQTVSHDSATSLTHHFAYVRDTIYALTRRSPNVLIRYNNPNDLSDFDTIRFSGYGASGGGMALVYVESKNRLYATLLNDAGTANNIAEINPATLSWSIVSSRGTSSWIYQHLATDNSYLYTVVADASYRDSVIKISLTDFTATAGLVTGNNTVSGYVHSLEYDGTHLYLTEYGMNPGKIYKVLPSDLSVVTSASFSSGDENPTDDLAFAGDYVWVGLETASGYVLRIKKSDLSITRVNTGSASISYGLYFDGRYMWNLHASSPGVLTRIDPETLEIWKHTLPSGENTPNEIITDGQRYFVAMYSLPSKITRFSVPLMTYVSGGPSTTVTASNGLTATSNNITLGGTLTGNTTIAQAGFTTNITNSATSMDLNIGPKIFQYTSDDPATPSYRNVTIRGSSQNKHAYMQITSGEKTAIMQVDSTTGISSIAQNTTTLHQSHIKVRYDSIELHAYDGIIHADTIKAATVDTADAKPLTWNPNTGRIEKYPYWPGGGGGGYTNLTQFVGQNNWKVFYSNGSGDVQELSIGTEGQVLTSNGTTAAPSWQDPTGGGDVTKVGTPVNNQVGVWTGDGTIEGDAGLTYDGTTDRLTVTGNLDGSAISPILVAGTGTGNLGTGITLDATNESGGRKKTIFSTGTTSSAGVGALAIYDITAGYQWVLGPTGEMIVGSETDLGDYRYQFHGYGIIQNMNSTDGGDVLKLKGSDGQSGKYFTVVNNSDGLIYDVTSAGVHDIYNTTSAPGSSVTNGVRLYADDVAASSELRVRDEAGNTTTLSPHNFSEIPGGKSEEMAWSFYSERDGKYITADMTLALRTIEQQSKEIEELKAQVSELMGKKYKKKKGVKLVHTGTK